MGCCESTAVANPNLAVAVAGVQDLVKWLAINTKKDDAKGGVHLATMAVSDVGALHCAATVAIRTQRQTGAFVWWLVNPTIDQLGQLSKEQDWSKRWGKDVDGKTERAAQGAGNLVWLADMKLTQNVPPGTWAEIRNRPEVLMTATFNYANNLDLSRTSPEGWAVGQYRVDFYLGETGDGRERCNDPAGRMVENGTKLVLNTKGDEKWFFAGQENIRKSITFEMTSEREGAAAENGVVTPHGVAMAI
jgi:hypothetical protein